MGHPRTRQVSNTSKQRTEADTRVKHHPKTGGVIHREGCCQCVPCQHIKITEGFYKPSCSKKKKIEERVSLKRSSENKTPSRKNWVALETVSIRTTDSGYVVLSCRHCWTQLLVVLTLPLRYTQVTRVTDMDSVTRQEPKYTVVCISVCVCVCVRVCPLYMHTCECVSLCNYMCLPYSNSFILGLTLPSWWSVLHFLLQNGNNQVVLGHQVVLHYEVCEPMTQERFILHAKTK